MVDANQDAGIFDQGHEVPYRFEKPFDAGPHTVPPKPAPNPPVLGGGRISWPASAGSGVGV